MRYFKEPKALVAAPKCPWSPFGTDDQHSGNTRYQPPAERFRSQTQADYGGGGGTALVLVEGRGAAHVARSRRRGARRGVLSTLVAGTTYADSGAASHDARW